MRYVMKQQLFALGDKFDICDSEGEKQFYVDGHIFTLGNKLSFQDTAGNELAFIKQKLLSWGPTYEIYRNGELSAVVKKQLFTLFNCRFFVDVHGPDDIEAEGDFLEHEYVFKRRGQAIGSASKQWFTLTDTYGIEVNDDADAVLLLACAVVIDVVYDDQRQHA